MLTPKEVAKLQKLYASGLTVMEIARKTRHDHNTVRKFVIHGAESGWLTKEKWPKKPVKLESYKAQVEEQVKAAYPSRVNITNLYEALRQQGYTGSRGAIYQHANSLVVELNRERERSPARQLEKLMNFVEDLGIFFNPDEFGTKAKLRSKTIVGFFNPCTEIVNDVQVIKPSFSCINAEVRGVKYGDIIRIQRKKFCIVYVKYQTSDIVTLVLENAA